MSLPEGSGHRPLQGDGGRGPDRDEGLKPIHECGHSAPEWERPDHDTFGLGFAASSRCPLDKPSAPELVLFFATM